MKDAKASDEIDPAAGDGSRCPVCGAVGRPIVFGLPGPDLFEAAERGEVLLGGCCVTGDDPTHGCDAGHSWRDPRARTDGVG